MMPMRPVPKRYAWGSSHRLQAIFPDFAGVDGPLAELWFSGHRQSSSMVLPEGEGGGIPLDGLVRREPLAMLGERVSSVWGPVLPYLMKVIAVHMPLSLQVHPVAFEARAGFHREQMRGVPVDSPRRSFKDTVDKYEMVVALEPFVASVGFAPLPRQIRLLRAVDHPLAGRMADALSGRLDAEDAGLDVFMPIAARAWSLTQRRVFRAFATAVTYGESEGASAGSVNWTSLLRSARASLSASGSDQRRAPDRHALAALDNAIAAARAFPGDPCVVCLLMMNAVRLAPGEAVAIAPGTVHAYIHGLAAEIMTNSDNVLRAGLTVKHRDVPSVLRNVDVMPAPPYRAERRRLGADAVAYRPEALREFSLTLASAGGFSTPARPRVAICLGGEAYLRSEAGRTVVLHGGEAVFVPAADGQMRVAVEAGPPVAGGGGTVPETQYAGGGLLLASTGI
ncbi:mannose-6-phosphate isomerase, class I [Bifidobacterium sp. SMB2]|uniref:mannose-6-phosphate isomerase n=1 Tax=Bifidobacterium saimiriisciurei TaxID=2661627 RepID=A0ABX0CF50_9BIFI|nr:MULTISPECIES: mannose-6-phosphate isomerase, class I [Bifidobacterium]NEG95176.1 mannose-6-phosphate isomerase, class I [Bifidobacterium sp. SMB2]NEH11253.1 mannose-6-phosphate isomerase, class I [Bifidobacterium saimiriisciurei]